MPGPDPDPVRLKTEQHDLVAGKRLLVASPFIAILAVVVVLAAFCMDILSATRAYVGGESRWTKAQKAAVQHLMLYAHTRNEVELQRFQQAIQVNLGDQRAREQLERPAPNYAVVRAGFIAGGNHPDDIAGMTRLFRWFRNAPFVDRAIGIWATADGLIAQVIVLSIDLEKAVASNVDARQIESYVSRITSLDERLTALEIEFSETLGEASRQTRKLLLAALLLVSIALLGIGGIVSRRVERRNAAYARALQASELRYQLAVAGTNDGLWDWDIVKDELYYAPQFLTLLGWPPGSLPTQIEHFTREFMHPDDRADVDSRMREHIRTDTPFDVEYRVRSGRGHYIWIRARGRAVRDGSGRAVRMAGSITDVTARRQAKAALRESETRFRSLWETTTDAVLIVDHKNIIRWTNPAALLLFGYSNEEMVGQTLALLQPARTQAAHQHGMERYLATGQRRLDWRSVEVAARRQDGVEFPIEISFSEIQIDGQPCFVGFLRDISRRKAAEDALRVANQDLEQRVAARTQELTRANKRLLELDRLKTEFLATMSHELRTPLNAIVGFSWMLREGKSGALSETQQQHVDLIHASGEHLLALINDLLDLSRIETGQMRIEHSSFDFADVVRDVWSNLKPQAERKSLSLGANLDPEQLPMLSDRRRCYQILFNLVGNAVKFTERGAVRIVALRDDRALEVTVADTGIGIDAAQIGQLFQPFRQIDSSLTRSHEGSGLGLYLCRQLVILLGGEITVQSEPGVGSRFTVRLPVRAPAVAL